MTASLSKDLLKDENRDHAEKKSSKYTRFLVEIFDRIQLVSFFLHFAVKLKRKIKICSFWPQVIYLEFLGAIKMRDKDEISI